MSKKIIKKLLKNKQKVIGKLNVLCIGDLILDHDVHGKIDRISPEAPIPIFLIKSESYQLGGAGNVAKNISSIGGKCSLLYLSNNKSSSNIINNLIKNEKNLKGIEIKVDKFRTSIKTRYKDKLKQIIRVDNEDTNFILKNKYKKVILSKLNCEINKFNLVVLSDYNKGLLDKDLIQKIIKIAKNNNIKIIADPKKNDLSAYSNIDLITPNEKEIIDASNKKNLNEKEIIIFSRKMIRKNNIESILVTRSEKGMILIDNKNIFKLKTTAKKVVDVTGAGDTVIGVLALMLSAGFHNKESAMISNHAAGLVIGKFGTETIKYNHLIK